MHSGYEFYTTTTRQLNKKAPTPLPPTSPSSNSSSLSPQRLLATLLASIFLLPTPLSPGLLKHQPSHSRNPKEPTNTHPQIQPPRRTRERNGSRNQPRARSSTRSRLVNHRREIRRHTAYDRRGRCRCTRGPKGSCRTWNRG